MAVKTTTSKILRHHMALKNGSSRYIDIDNPVSDTSVISANITQLNYALSGVAIAGFNVQDVLVGSDYFDGNTDAVVTACTSAEIIQTTKTVTTTDISL